MTDEPDAQRVSRILKARMAHAALAHAKTFDLRTGAMLELNGLVEGRETGDLGNDAFEILTNPSHPSRMRAVEGPVIFYRDLANEHHRFAVDVRQLFFSPDVRVRMAAWEHFGADESQMRMHITHNTFQTLVDLKDRIESEEKAVRLRASLEARDAIDNDIICQLQGVRQSIDEHFEEGLRYYIPKLLRPKISAIISVGIAFIRPSEEGDSILDAINDLITKSPHISVFCDGYIHAFGTLPLSGPASFVNALEAWASAHGTNIAWPELVEWAKRARSPLARFYCCYFLLARPNAGELSPKSSVCAVLLDLLLLNDENDKTIASADRLFWRTVHELAQHYLRHFEMHAPGASPEQLAIASWWLAERFAEVLSARPEALQHLRRAVLIEETERSEWAWRLANPRMPLHAAALATHWPTGPWQLSMLGVLANADSEVIATIVPEERRSALEQCICRHMIFGTPTSADEATAANYLFQIDYAQAIRGLKGIVSDLSGKEFLDTLGAFHAMMSNPDRFVEKLATISEVDEAEQIIVANGLRLLALRGRLPLDAVWDKLIDTKWRNETFKELSQTALEILFLTLAISLARGGDKWQAGLPHIFAQACEDAVSEAETAKVLFALTLFSSIHCHTVSGVERLLKGPRRAEFIGLGKWWKASLAERMRTFPPWVSARSRALIAAISSAV